MTTFKIELTEEECQEAERAIKDALALKKYTGFAQLTLEKVLEKINKA